MGNGGEGERGREGGRERGRQGGRETLMVRSLEQVASFFP
jgi:hypothetical protein